jgi:tetratricopeptide (TPR) repeat protein
MYRLYDRTLAWLDKAFEAAKRAVELDPSSMRSHTAMSYVYRLKDDESRAIEEAKIAISLEPNNAASYFQLAFNYADMKRPKDAIEPLRRAIELDPTFFSAYQNLFSALAAIGDEEGYKVLAVDALPQYERMVRLDTKNSHYKTELAQCYAATGRTEEGDRILTELLATEHDPLYLYNIGIALTNIGKYAEGYLAQKRAYELGFKRFDLWRGKVYAERHADDEELLKIIHEVGELVMRKQQEVKNG